MERLLSQGDSDKDTVQKMCHPLCYCDKCEKLVSGWAPFTPQMQRKLCRSLYLRFPSGNMLLLVVTEFGSTSGCSGEHVGVCGVKKHKNYWEHTESFGTHPFCDGACVGFGKHGVSSLNQAYKSGSNPLLLTKCKGLHGIICQCKRIKSSKIIFLPPLAALPFLFSFLPPPG